MADTLADQKLVELAAPWSGLAPGSARGACLRNILAKLRTVPTVAEPLLAEVLAVEVVKEERVYCHVTPAFLARMLALSDGDGDERVFSAEGRPGAHVHQDLLTWAAVHQPHWTEPYVDLASYRERVTFFSMQVVVTQGCQQAGAQAYADIDIDIGGLRTDMVGWFRHLLELVCPSQRTTDAVALQARLRKDPALRPYLGGEG